MSKPSILRTLTTKVTLYCIKYDCFKKEGVKCLLLGVSLTCKRTRYHASRKTKDYWTFSVNIDIQQNICNHICLINKITWDILLCIFLLKQKLGNSFVLFSIWIFLFLLFLPCKSFYYSMRSIGFLIVLSLASADSNISLIFSRKKRML